MFLTHNTRRRPGYTHTPTVNETDTGLDRGLMADMGLNWGLMAKNVHFRTSVQTLDVFNA